MKRKKEKKTLEKERTKRTKKKNSKIIRDNRTIDEGYSADNRKKGAITQQQ